jgi:hypothetical protein
MVPKTVFAALICAGYLAAAPALAEQYQPDEFLTLDLAKAVLSPKPLGPPARFEPMPVQAKTDSQARAVKAEPIHVDPVPRHANAIRKTPKVRIVHAPVSRPSPPARTRVVRRHGNPLDAQAADTRIQVWPCRSGGICNWQRAAQ